MPARAVAFTSTDIGRDLAKLADREDVDLVLLDGRRPFRGEGVPRGEVGSVLRRAPSDVAVLVAREDAVVAPGPDAPLVVPFGGAEHDWAALELGAWLAASTGAPLRLLGATGEGEGEDDASRLLATASLLVQRFVGVAAEPLLAAPGRDGLLEAAAGAGLLVIGLSDRWREEGLGPVRHEIASGRAGADPLRPPRPTPRRARAAHRRHAVHVVARGRRERLIRRARRRAAAPGARPTAPAGCAARRGSG